MKIQDIVYLEDERGGIVLTVVESIREIHTDGKHQQTECLVSEGLGYIPTWIPADKLFTSSEALIKNMKRREVLGIDRKLNSLKIHDSRFKDGINPDDPVEQEPEKIKYKRMHNMGGAFSTSWTA